MRKRPAGIAGAAVFACLAAIPVQAQQQGTANPLLEEIVVTATRIPTDLNDLPFAAASVGRDAIQQGRQQLGLDESLAGIPGLFFQNRYNFAQDLRIAIRGFGARANFGIRGIRIFADNIPLTLPDGQGSVDSIDLGSAEEIQVIRGPFSAVYGAASGGVISLTTEEGPERPFLSARLNFGSYDYRQGQLKTGGTSGKLNWLANFSLTELDGYRDHSRLENRLFNGKFRYRFSDQTDLVVVFNAIDSPIAEDPGALNAHEVEEDRRQAAPRNLLFNAGESLDQQSLGLSFRHQPSEGQQLQLRAYAVNRDFANRLPFDINSNGQGGSVRLDRSFYGFGGNYGWDFDTGNVGHQLIAGLDYDAQRDRRRRYANNQGLLGRLTTDQDEDVTNLGLYIQDVIDFTSRISMTLGARHDSIKYEVTDRTGSGGDGERTFTQFSPMAGLNWSATDTLNVYGNVSRSFDPPSTTELANPDGPTGFNENLEPQTATNYEIGLKGLVVERLRYDLALFRIDAKDEIVPFELEGSGQSFFENAGSSTRKGIEASLSFEIVTGLTAAAAYTWSDFTFDRFRGTDGEDYDGNRIPGVPEHLFSLDLNWVHESGLYAAWDWLYAGSFSANNANTVETDSYQVSNLRFGYLWNREGWRLEPFVGVNNLFDEKYNGNVRLNASFGRYYEPAPERNVYGGLLLGYDF